MLHLGEEVEDITRTVLLGPGEGRQKGQVHYSLFTQAAGILGTYLLVLHQFR